MHIGLKKYFSNTVWLFLGNGIKIVTSFIISIYIIRYLGPEKFGMISYAMSFIGLLNGFATFKLHSLVVKALLNKPTEKDKIFGSAYLIQLIGSTSIIIFFAIYISQTDLQMIAKLVFLFMLPGIFFQSFKVIELYFEANVISHFTMKLLLIKEIILAIVKILLLIYQANVLMFAAVISLDHFLYAAGLITLYKLKVSSITKWRFKKEYVLKLVRESFPLMLSGTLVTINTKVDQIMIKNFIDFSAVGNYAAGIKFNQILNVMPMLIAGSFFPAIINAKKRSKKIYISRLSLLYQLMFFITLMIAIPAMIFSKQFITFVYDAGYHDTTSVFQIYIWVIVFSFVGVVRGKWIIIEGYQRLSLLYNFIAVIYNLVANYFLIPIYGIRIAAVNTLISMFLAIYLLNLLNKKTHILFIMLSKSFFDVITFKFIIRAYHEAKNHSFLTYKS